MATLDLTVVIDNKAALNKLRELLNVAKNTTTSIVTDADRMDAAMRRFSSTLAQIGVGISLTGLIRQIALTRGEFQQLEVAFTTLLQNKEKADALMKQMVNLAATTPFDLQGVADGARQLLAYGFAAEDITDTLTRLGNVAAGLGLPLERLTYLYGTTAVQGRLYARDMLQFTGSGIPVLQELSKMYGKTTEEINEMVSAGKIGFNDIKKVFENMTNAGGQFYNLMENQSKTITGLISNLGDAIDTMFNDIGKSQEGIISNVLQGAISLVENYKKVLDILIPLVAAYGAYKAALIATAAIQQVKTTVAATKALLEQTKMLRKATVAQIIFNQTVKKNPYVIAISLLVALGTAIYRYAKGTNAASKATAVYNQYVTEENKKLEEVFQNLNKSEKGTINRKRAIDNINSEYGEYLSNMLSEASNAKEIANAYKEISDAINETALAKAKVEFTQKPLEKLQKAEKYFWEELGDYSKELSPKAQGIFTKEIENIINKAKQGGEKLSKFDFELFAKAFKEAWRIDHPDQILNDIDVFDIVGNWDIAQVEDGYHQIIRAANELTQAENNFQEFSKAYIESDNKKIEEETNQTISAAENLKAAQDAYNSAYAAWKKAIRDGEDISFVKEKKAAVDNAGKALNEAKEAAGIDDKSIKNLIKLQNDAEEELAKIRLKNEQAANDAAISMMHEGTDKQLAEIENRKQQKLQAIEQERKAMKKKAQEAGTTLSSKDEKNLQTQIDAVNKEAALSSEKVYRNELQQMDNYLKSYGTFQEKKLAIAQEYDRKIADATNQYEIQSLQQQKENEIRQVDVESLKAQIDWTTVFGEFGGMFKDVIKPVLEDVKAYIKTDDFKNLNPTDQETLIRAIQQMEQSIGESGKLDFKGLGEVVSKLQEEQRKLLEAEKKQKDALEKLKKATDEYEESLKGGTATDRERASQNLSTAQSEADEASREVREQSQNVTTAQENVETAANGLSQSMKDVTDGLSKLASGSLSQAWSGLLQAGSKIDGAIGVVSEKLQNVPIIGWILSIIDIFKDGLSNIIGGLLDAVFNAVSGIIGDVLSGDLVITILKSVRNGLKNVFDALTFGGISSMFDAINGSNAKEVQRTTERLTAANKSLEQSINALKDRIDKEKLGALDSASAYKEAIAKQKQVTKNTSGILAAQMGYHDAHHSNDYYISRDLTAEDWYRISQQIGKSVQNTSDLWNLSPEDLKKVSELTDIWVKIYSGGKYDKTEYIDQYLEQAYKIEELEDGLKEALTKVSFDSIYDSFIDTLMDMEASADDFAKDVSQLMMKAMISEMVASKYKDRLKKWYDDFADAMYDGELTEQEIEQLQESNRKIAEDAIKERDAIAKVLGYTSDDSAEAQKASARGFQAMSQDTGDELNGRFTDIQGKVTDIRDYVLQITANGTMQLNEVINIRDIMIQINGNVADIRTNTNVLPDMSAKLDKIIRNTENI